MALHSRVVTNSYSICNRTSVTATAQSLSASNREGGTPEKFEDGNDERYGCNDSTGHDCGG